MAKKRGDIINIRTIKIENYVKKVQEVSCIRVLTGDDPEGHAAYVGSPARFLERNYKVKGSRVRAIQAHNNSTLNIYVTIPEPAVATA